ncbi:hypothetical protein [Taibaiella soli]|uniref:Uncharacterized protein n=1 Tax=Taibaiella soli TaxID=1649169 RepID=A0A2W2B0N8_9BACT|nr:hypothetical protein [Taibaiella soli]PZF73834.1 hypothetical protein DN068_05685 [Taibaiella soli]
MIWIQSTDDDLSTNMVIDWFDLLKVDWCRTNDAIVQFKNFAISNTKNDFQISFKDVAEHQHNIRLSDIAGYWYRRGHLSFGITSNAESREWCHPAECN